MFDQHKFSRYGGPGQMRGLIVRSDYRRAGLASSEPLNCSDVADACGSLHFLPAAWSDALRALRVLRAQLG